MTTSPAIEMAGLDAVAQAELVRRGEVTAAELVGWAIERIEDLNPILNAVITPMYEQALAAAAMTPSTGRLAGVPYLVKDLIAEVAGVPLSEGSRFLRGHVSHFDSELVLRLRRAGLVIVGKTNTPEFGMAPTCEPILHGPTRNPWDTTRLTSGSSGGSAAAVAARMVPMAHGNDLGGSIRYPASACGLFGLKPTRARNPLGPEYGDAVNGWACEHALTRTVRDSAVLLDATAEPAIGDPYSPSAPVRPFADEVGRDPGRLRIGYTASRPRGARPTQTAWPHSTTRSRSAHRWATSWSKLACPGSPLRSEQRSDQSSAPPQRGSSGTGSAASAAPADDELEPLTRAYWEMGQKVSAADYLLAIEDCQAFARRVAHFLTGIDVWLTPTMSAPPALIGEITSTVAEPLRALERGGPTIASAGVVANITGSPAMSVPLWQNTSGLPIGVHFLGRYGDEATLFQLASQLESARPWPERIPPVTTGGERPGMT